MESMVDLILHKREGGAFTRAQIDTWVRGAAQGTVPDYQLAALLMAICLRGMTAEETRDLTLSMAESGRMADLSGVGGVCVDKHSTGGVGDTTTLILAPLVAACGVPVAKMSGRGLGHTGGTLDKLESIPGLRVDLSEEAFLRQVRDIGVAVIGQTKNLAPADKTLYALRDVTATVRSIPLIASSVMSKKLACGADAIVLDVKAGSGAFMRTPEQARALAESMVDIGAQLGRRVAAIITDMDQPLGQAVGNALEVREAVELLSGRLPEDDPLLAVCLLLGEQMLLMAGLAADAAVARSMLLDALKSGAGLEKLRRMVALLGGRSEYLSVERMDELCAVREKIDVPAEADGFVCAMQAERIGTAAQLLGAGRAKKDDAIDPAVGLVMHVRRGAAVRRGDALCTLYVNDGSRAQEAAALVRSAVRIAPERPAPVPMVYGVVQRAGA